MKETFSSGLPEDEHAQEPVADLLDRVEPDDPCLDFTDQVMRRVAAMQPHARQRQQVSAWSRLVASLVGHQLSPGSQRHSAQDEPRRELPGWLAGWTGGGAIVAKKTLWAIAGLAVVVILVAVYFNGARSVQQGAEGTIGAAQRYRGAQPTGADVTLQKAEAQKFLQSDTFDRLMKDKAVRHMLSSEEGRRLLSSSLFADALAGPGLAAALANESMDQALASTELAAAMNDANFAGLFADANLRRVLGSPETVAVLAKPGVLQALQDDKLVAAALAKTPEAELVAHDKAALAQYKVLSQALASPLMQQLVQSRGFMQAIDNQLVCRALNSTAFSQLSQNAALFQALADPGLQSLLRDARLSAALTDPATALAFGNADLVAALTANSGLAAALADQPALAAALGQFDGEGLRKK